MKRISSLICIAALSVAALTGCGDSKTLANGTCGSKSFTLYTANDTMTLNNVDFYNFAPDVMTSAPSSKCEVKLTEQSGTYAVASNTYNTTKIYLTNSKNELYIVGTNTAPSKRPSTIKIKLNDSGSQADTYTLRY